MKIDKNIPIPELKNRGRSYPWYSLDVGDSFLYPGDFRRAQISAYTANVRYKPKNFIARDTPEGPRIWRLR